MPEQPARSGPGEPVETLLIVDDEEQILTQLSWALRSDFQVLTARTAAEAIAAVKSAKPPLMILDLSLTGEPWNVDGLAVLEEALALNPSMKVVIMTGHDEKENALKAIERGAYDFCSKTTATRELKVILKRAAYLLFIERELRALKTRETEQYDYEGIVSMAPSMQQIFETIGTVSPTDVTVLITGESGTGKELVAHAIHAKSARRARPFVPINCGAIPENLLESELFGHEKGSFTGAVATKPGKFEIADGGTIFLDEIGELPQNLQVKLLRFLQDHLIEHIGGHEPLKVDVRIIAATNQPLRRMIEEKRFREDLFYRINTISIELPPLRERPEDIPLLAMLFLKRHALEFQRSVRGYSAAAMAALGAYQWPGNVRELESRVKRAIIMAKGKLIEPLDLDLVPAGGPASPGGAEGASGDGSPGGEAAGSGAPRGAGTLREARDEVERRMVVNALIMSRGNVSAAAEALDVSRPTLHDLMKKHGIDPEDFRPAKG